VGPLLRPGLSLQTQTLPADQFEVLVIDDNGSTDPTKQVVETFFLLKATKKHK
jgi:glycosyltransferase involved in cell wall biosynthesis